MNKGEILRVIRALKLELSGQFVVFSRNVFFMHCPEMYLRHEKLKLSFLAR